MSAPVPVTFGALLRQEVGVPDPEDVDRLRRLRARLLLPLAIASILTAAWTAFAPLSGAVVAPAQIKVELNRKVVQHQEGGIVRELLVRDGQRVRAGEPLVVVGDLRSQTELSLLQDRLRTERIRMLRASAEAALEPTFTLPHEEHFAAASDSAVRELALFAARRRTLDEQIAALAAQSQQAQVQGGALELQIEASETATKLAGDELALNQKLVQEGYVQGARILQLRRTEAEYRSRIGESRSELALARQRDADLRARAAQIRNQYQQQAADELKDASAKVRELEERLLPSLDQVERQVVRAPVDGEVMALRVSAVGAVIAPREPLLEIVPSQERLVVEAHIRPEDISYVHRGGAAQVRLTAFDARSTPLLTGKVTFVSGDRMTLPDGRESFFTATVEVDATSMQDRPDITLHAGMPAELYVLTGERTLFQYLMRPLDTFSKRAMREP
jgi:HlyD family type I secretion membrane fusion protein